MKKTISLILFICCTLMVFQACNKNEKTTKVEKVANLKGVYRYQNFYIAAQPSVDDLSWYKKQGVKSIINLRTEKENKEFASNVYKEKKQVNDLGLAYYSVPIGGSDAYAPENLKLMATHIKENEKVVIHCRSAGRATILFMAYLVKYRGFSLNEATKIGEQIKFSFPLEKILDTKINFEIIS